MLQEEKIGLEAAIQIKEKLLTLRDDGVRVVEGLHTQKKEMQPSSQERSGAIAALGVQSTHGNLKSSLARTTSVQKIMARLGES